MHQAPYLANGICPLQMAFALYRWHLPSTDGICPLQMAFALYR
ncbi:hypothetical protein [Okeania sp. KiyG1]|nr:hypothetical protein [Okeania sp. KiyG1]